MKKRYITTQLLLVCLSRLAAISKDIHKQLAEIIAERKRILREVAGANLPAKIGYSFGAEEYDRRAEEDYA